MAKAEMTYRIAEVTIVSGRQKHIRITVDDKTVHIPIDEAVYAYFTEQFAKSNPAAAQKKRFATLMNIARSACLKGVEDGKASA
ncbi:MAG: hypothetical protein HY894_04300 [Deltaproteobacteria bacterium]|nr:hypothetical protein [Deltaproteobacteria bacterium]